VTAVMDGILLNKYERGKVGIVCPGGLLPESRIGVEKYPMCYRKGWEFEMILK